ncbi:MAG: CinA family protein [Micrococcales bacterium]
MSNLPAAAASEAAAVLQAATNRGLKLAVAESLTGGLVSAELAAVPGASNVLLGAVVAYQNAVKQSALGVPQDSLDRFGAVSGQVALEMAKGARVRFAGHCGITDELVVGLATTGVAGPDAIEGKAVGTVFIALSSFAGDRVVELKLSGSREQIRQGTVGAALKLFLEHFQA